MFKGSRTTFIAGALTFLVFATGCFFLAFTPIADPGGSIGFEGIIQESDPDWSIDSEALLLCIGYLFPFEGKGPDVNYDVHAITNRTGSDQRISVTVNWDLGQGLLALYAIETPQVQLPALPPGFPPLPPIPAVPVTPDLNLPLVGFDPANTEDCLAIGFPLNGTSEIRNEPMFDGESFAIVVADGFFLSEGDGDLPYEITVETR